MLSVNLRDSFLSSGSEDDSIAVFDLSRGEAEPLELLLNPEHPVRTAGLAADGQVYFETLDNHLGWYDFSTGGKACSHFFENSHEEKTVYLIKSNAQSVIGGVERSFKLYSAEGTRVKEWEVTAEGLREIAFYNAGSDALIKDCETVGDFLASVHDSGDVTISAKQEWNLDSEISAYYAN